MSSPTENLNIILRSDKFWS